jgi:RNA polymerase sigma-70 factor (ECF subfamily)
VTASPPTFARAREEFLALVADVRPELHRYAARLTGSVIEGEDIVQDTLAKALYALSQSVEVPALRPWLFRIAHNAAMDFLKSHGRKYLAPDVELDAIASTDEPPDPWIVRAALARFLELPPAQRSAVILKDVLDHSLEEVADTMGSSVMAVKALLVRGRAKLRAAGVAEDEPTVVARADLERYVERFNSRDWEGLRALVSDDCRLDLVSKSQRRGKEVGAYFARYEKENLTLDLVRLEGELALAVYVKGATTPSYFMLLEFQAGLVAKIRDYRYVPYIALEAEYERVEHAQGRLDH